MMRRVDLVPASYRERRRQRQTLSAIVVVGVVLAVLLFGWWFLLGQQINDREEELASVRAANARLQEDIDELQRFADLEAEVQDKVSALQTVMAGDINWPKVLTEVALVVPGEIWFEQMSGSAGATEGASPVGTETAAVRIVDETPTGRLTFTGRTLSMPGVAKWLIRQMSVKDFQAIWLNNAAFTEEGNVDAAGVVVGDWESTLELGPEALSDRFQQVTP
jgi:Tfp pilus assembly protein PilN